jgi:hypothetical protein
MKRNDVIGDRFGKLKALEYVGIDKHGNRQVRCLCDCGNEKICRAASLIQGRTKSCGYSRLGMGLRDSKPCGGTIHRRRNQKRPDRLYRIWVAMKQRCYNPKNRAFHFYGGRGIKVCEEWLNSSKKFSEWAINNGYREDLSIDRIDVNGDYEPSNCRWATSVEQNLNRRPRKSKEEASNGKWIANRSQRTADGDAGSVGSDFCKTAGRKGEAE